MFQLSAEGRLQAWRDFRKTLDSLTLEQATESVAEFWHGCPFVPYNLDPADPTSWPTPWEMITENYYCDLAKAIGMLYTLYFTTHGTGLDVEIRVYGDPRTDYEYNLAVLSQGKYVLNFRDASVVNIESLNKNLVLKHQYSSKELKLEEY